MNDKTRRGTSCCTWLVICSLATAAERPNIITILTDDQGWADVGVQGIVPDIRTPHLDALAERGVRCTAGYVTAPQCSPSRAGLMTGVYQQRLGIDTIPDMPLPSDAVTIAERLQRLGYRTGFVGKWHLEPNVTCIAWMQRELPAMAAKPRQQIRIPWDKVRPYAPAAQGFDEYFWGELHQYRVNYLLDSAGLLPQMQLVQDPAFRIDVQTRAAVKFIERNHAAPFYLHVAYYGPHTPLQATPQYLSRFVGEMPTRRRYALAMISAIDEGIRQIVACLQVHGLLHNTLIIFTSDNGAPLKMTKPDTPIDGDHGGWDGSLNDPWVGEKGMLSEGGIRVPMIWSLPTVLRQGVEFHQPVSTLDIVPSVLHLAGGDAARHNQHEPALDGVNIIPALAGSERLAERSLYFRFWDQAAVRRGKWKLLIVGQDQQYLFDLESDLHEQVNRIDEQPQLAAQLQEELRAWCAELQPPGLPAGNKMRERNWYQHYFAR